MRRFSLAPVVGLALVLVVAGLQAVPPDEAGSAQTFPVTPQAGAWLICAASYTGPDAPELARQLVWHIRSRHNLPAFVFNHADEERKKNNREEQERLKAQNPIIPVRRRVIRVEEQCAVLVGGYADIESARKAVDGIKKLPPPELKLASGRPTVDMIVTNPDGKGVRSQPVNPFTNAFVTRNPSIPDQQADGQTIKVDPAWFKLNDGVEYSLLTNPQPWTLVVRQYVGARVVQSAGQTGGSLIDKLWSGANKPGDALDASAKQAHELAKLLRQLNMPAYVLHTRTSSVVTVGGFKSPDDPDMQHVRSQLVELQARMTDGARKALQLNAVPAPMPVPRQ